MQIFLVSVRTALIYGPGEMLVLSESSGNQVFLKMTWPHARDLNDWEGYVVVAPERNQVWGLCQPEWESDYQENLQVFFTFAPQPIPPKDRKLFENFKPVSTEEQES